MRDLRELIERERPTLIAAAWAAWHKPHGGRLGPGPAFVEAIDAIPYHPPRSQFGDGEGRSYMGEVTVDEGIVALDLICKIEFGKEWGEASEGEQQWCRNYLKEITAFIDDDKRWPTHLPGKTRQ
jgi:hypothetical protein